MIRKSRLLAAQFVSSLVELDLQLNQLQFLQAKSGIAYLKTAETCEFSCLEPAVCTLWCAHSVDQDFWNPPRNACVQHRLVRKIRCDCAGRKGCSVTCRKEILLEDRPVLVDEVEVEKVAYSAMLGPWGELGPVLECYSKYKKAMIDEMVVPDIASQADESLSAVVVECDKALSAEVQELSVVDVPVRRKSRGGMRNKAKQNGYCYLKPVPKLLRRVAMAHLGKNPRIVDVLEFYDWHKIIPRNLAVILLGDGHFVKRPNWPFHIQRRYLELFHFNNRLGSLDVELMLSKIEAVADTGVFHDDEAILGLIRPHFPALFPLVQGDMAKVDREVLEVKADIQDSQEELQPVFVSGPGDCWKRIPGFYQGDQFRMTAKELVAKFENEIEMDYGDNFVAVKWCWQEDGDLHVEATTPQSSCGLPQGYVTQESFKTVLVEAAERLVGSDRSGWSKTAAKLGPIQRNVVDQEIYRDLSRVYQKAQAICPWQITPKAAEWMNKLNLPWAEEFTDPHTHPIHAAIRRWTYKSEIPDIVQGSCTFVGMKQSHFDMVVEALRKKYGEKFQYDLVNPIVTIKDERRYDANDKPRADFTSADFKHPYVWFDESGQFLEPALMEELYTIPGIKFVGYSSIFPLNALAFEKSPHPEFADWRIVRKGSAVDIVYAPEGHWDEPYVQPFDPTMILAKEFRDHRGGLLWSGGVVGAKGNHRLHLFARDQLIGCEFTAVTEFRYMSLPKLFVGQPELPPILVKDYLAMFMYLRGTGAYDAKNLAAKLRNMIFQENLYVTPGAVDWTIKIMLEVCRLRLTCDLEPVAYTNLLEEVRHKTWGKVVSLYQSVFTERYMKRNFQLTSNLDPVVLYPGLSVAVQGGVRDNYSNVTWTIGIDTHLWLGLGAWLHWYHGVPRLPDMLFRKGDRVVFPFTGRSIWRKERRGYRLLMDGRSNVITLKATEESSLLAAIDEEMTILQNVLAELEAEDVEDNIVPPAETSPVDQSSEISDEVVSIIDVTDEVTDLASVAPKDDKPGFIRFGDGDMVHCEDCPTYKEFTERGGEPNEEAFLLAILSFHAADEEVNQSQRAIKRAIAEKVAYSRAGSNSLAAPERNFVIDGVTRSDLLQPSHYLPVSKVQKSYPKRLYQKCVEDWGKMLKLKPAFPTVTSHATGETMWDGLFPQTVSHRFNRVPFRDVVEYPSLPYPDNDCLLVALGEGLAKAPAEIYFRMIRAFPRSAITENMAGLPLAAIDPVALHYGVAVTVVDPLFTVLGSYGVDDQKGEVRLLFENDHVRCVRKLSSLLIQPRKMIHLPIEPNETIKRLSMWPAVHWVDWMPEPKRAADYVRALIARTTGLLGEPINSDELKVWDAICDHAQPQNKRFAIVMGDPGCRKSSRPQSILKTDREPMSFVAVLPMSGLAQDWRDKLDATAVIKGRKLPGRSVITFEKALAQGAVGRIAIYDENKFPKGYIALHNILNPAISHVLFLCDPWQASWHEPNGDCLLNASDIPGEAELYMKYSKRYLLGTWRYGPGVANFWRQPTFSSKYGGIVFNDQMPKHWRELSLFWPSLSEASHEAMWKNRLELYAAHADTMWADQIRGYSTNTYAGAQGKTEILTVVEVDERMIRGGDVRLLYAAMTRSPFIMLVRKWRENGQNESYVYNHPVFRHLEFYRKNYVRGHDICIVPEHSVSIRDITFSFPPGLEIVLAGPPDKLVNWSFVGQFYDEDQLTRFLDPDERVAGTRLDFADPRLVDNKFYSFWCDRVVNFEECQPFEASPEVATVVSSQPKTSLPIASRDAVLEDHVSRTLDRHKAELRDPLLGMSEQLPDWKVRRKDAVDVMKRLLGKRKGRERRAETQRIFGMDPNESPLYADPSLLNFGLDQRSSDDVSFRAAMKQRVTWTTAEKNREEYRDAADFGSAATEALWKYLGWSEDVPFDDVLFERSVLAFQERRAEKSESLTLAAMNRADPDFGVVLTAKQQFKLKKRSSEEAKPLQTITIHSDSYLYEHGPYGIYILRQLMRHRPDHWCFYAEMTPADLQDWCAGHFPKGSTFHMSDMTAQDQSMRGWAVHVMANVMRRFKLPAFFVRSFIHDKLNKHIGTKCKQTGTDTGEIWTYLLNTICTTAREALMYDLPFGFPMANGGDDILRLAGPKLSSYYERSLASLDVCVDKRFESLTGEFVSFRYRDGLLCKDPVLLLRRQFAKLSVGQGASCVLGYMQLWRENYLLRDRLYDMFDETEMEAHAVLTRFFMNLSAEGLQTRATKKLLEGLNNEGSDEGTTRATVRYSDEHYTNGSGTDTFGDSTSADREGDRVAWTSHGCGVQETIWEG